MDAKSLLLPKHACAKCNPLYSAADPFAPHAPLAPPPTPTLTPTGAVAQRRNGYGAGRRSLTWCGWRGCTAPRQAVTWQNPL